MQNRAEQERRDDDAAKAMPEQSIRAYARAARILMNAVEGRDIGLIDTFLLRRARSLAMTAPSSGVFRLMVIADRHGAMDEETAELVDRQVSSVPAPVAARCLEDDRSRQIWLGEYRKNVDAREAAEREERKARQEAEDAETIRKLEDMLAERDGRIAELEGALAEATRALEAAEAGSPEHGDRKDAAPEADDPNAPVADDEEEPAEDGGEAEVSPNEPEEDADDEIELSADEERAALGF